MLARLDPPLSKTLVWVAGLGQGVENLGGPPRSRNKTPLVSDVRIERSHERVDEETHRYAQESGIEHNRLHQDEA
jgi:hypothetical protein